MNRVTFILLPAIFSFLTATGQNDPQAIAILDSFASKASGAPSISMEFTMARSDLAENKADTVSGSVIICKDKYWLNMGENIVWFNGETTWNYLKAEKEVTITKADKKDHSFQNHPSEIFTMYKSGYKSRLVEENAGICTIDLYPVDIKSDLVRVRLSIRKNDLSLLGFEYKLKDGVDINVTIKDYNLRNKTDQSTFTFPADKYKGVDINDMR